MHCLPLWQSARTLGAFGTYAQWPGTLFDIHTGGGYSRLPPLEVSGSEAMLGQLQQHMHAAPFAMPMAPTSLGPYSGVDAPSTSAAQISADISASLALLLQQQEVQLQQQQLHQQQPQQVPAPVEHPAASQVLRQCHTMML